MTSKTALTNINSGVIVRNRPTPDQFWICKLSLQRTVVIVKLAVFIRFVSPDFVVKEELLDLVELQESTRGVDIKNSLDSIMKTFDVPLNKLVSWLKNRSYWTFKGWFLNSIIHTDSLHNLPRTTHYRIFKISWCYENSVTQCKLHSHQSKKIENSKISLTI